MAALATISFARDWRDLYALPRMNTPPPGHELVRHVDAHEKTQQEVGTTAGKVEWHKHWSLVLWRDTTDGVVYPAHFQDWTSQLAYERKLILQAASQLTYLIGGLWLFRAFPNVSAKQLQVISNGTVSVCHKPAVWE